MTRGKFVKTVNGGVAVAGVITTLTALERMMGDTARARKMPLRSLGRTG